MIAGILIRHYKNYSNLHFVPICDNADDKYSIFVGNNGVGKSAVLEAIDVIFNERFWNITTGQKKTEAYICPLYIVEKSKISTSNKDKIEVFSDFLWNVDESINANFKTNDELKHWMEYKNQLKEKYEDTHYFIMVGKQYDNSSAYVVSVHDAMKKELSSKFSVDDEGSQAIIDEIRKTVEDLYRYIYIPVEESPNELLKLQNTAMQQLLNKNLLAEIERLLNRKPNSESIVNLINKNLDEFIDEVNDTILKIDEQYSFTNEPGSKRKLTAKDIREKILEAYFPLRTLKVQGRNVDQLSSGEQRRAVIDVIYSVLIANKDKKTEKEIIIAIDEPETSMHISNCFGQFLRLEELSRKYKKQVMVTTHWYGFLPITHNGNMQHIQCNDGTTFVSSFALSNVLEERRRFPDVIDLKSMYDLATSILTYMRFHQEYTWIICEGSDDKVYLESVLNDKEKFLILPVGGCGNVIKLHHLLYSPLTEKSEVSSGRCLFLMDTDLQMQIITKPLEYSADKPRGICLRRLQISNGKIMLFDPCVSNTYSQTEMEDCLIADIYFEALQNCINGTKNAKLKALVKKFKCKENVVGSRLKGEDACIVPTDIKALEEKSKIIEFAEDSANKYIIANEYNRICNERQPYPEHELKNVINNLWR